MSSRNSAQATSAPIDRRRHAHETLEGFRKRDFGLITDGFGDHGETPKGLMVPVIRDCDKKSLREISQEITSISLKAREKGLTLDEMSGGCFSVSSLGGIGGTYFTPIINAPEVAILGVCRAFPKPRPAADGGTDWRSTLPLSLSYDHRVIDGADAARFVAFLASVLALPDKL